MGTHTTIIKEIKFQNHTVRVSNNRIIHVTAIGEATDQSAVAYRKFYYELLESLAENEKVDFMIDINNLGKQSPKTRKLWNDLSEDKRVRAAAVFGANLISKVLANFVIGLSRKQDFRLFNTEEEAMRWLMKIRKNEQ